MDADELGLAVVIYAILGVLVAVPVAGLLVAALASGLGGRRFGLVLPPDAFPERIRRIR